MIEQSYSIVSSLKPPWRYFSISSMRGLVLSPIGAWGVLFADLSAHRAEPASREDQSYREGLTVDTKCVHNIR